MPDEFHVASEQDVTALWPAVSTARLFEGEDEYRTQLAAAPWKLRVDGAGNAALLGRWRDHLGILHIRAAWCDRRRIPNLLADVRGVACDRGLDEILSPLAEEAAVRPYLDAGMEVRERLVLLRARPRDVRPALPRAGVELREATEDDLDSIVSLEQACFEAFWQSGPRLIADRLRRDRLVLATLGGETIGYTLTTLSRDGGSLGGLAIHPSERRRGVGSALVAEAAAHLEALGARTMTLSTQEHNTASRAMYAKAGLAEVRDRLVFASGESGCS